MEDTAQQGGNESQQLFMWFFTLKQNHIGPLFLSNGPYI